MYAGVPSSMPVLVLFPMPPATSMTFAMPKSSSLTDEVPLGLAREEHVARLEIAVHDALVVRVLEPREHPEEDRHRLRDRDAAAVPRVGAEGDALEQLHDEVRLPSSAVLHSCTWRMLG